MESTGAKYDAQLVFVPLAGPGAMRACRLCNLRGLKERERATLLGNRGLQRGNNITRLRVVLDLPRGSALLLSLGTNCIASEFMMSEVNVQKFEPNRYQ